MAEENEQQQQQEQQRQEQQQEEQEEQEPPPAPKHRQRARTSSTPSLVSPVGDVGGYAMSMDDTDDELDVSPVPHELSQRGGDDDSEWHYFDNDIDDGVDNGGMIVPRFRLDNNADDDGIGPNDLHAPLLESHRQPAKANGLNYLNVLAYLINVFVSYGIGVWGLGGFLPTRLDISQTYVTLVTPAEWAYYLWAPILVFEAIFAIAQLFPHYRARPIIQQGTSYFFFYTCIIQTGWTLFFAFELFIFSFVSVLAALISLSSLLASQHYSQIRGRRSLVEYWLFKFPFYLHCGLLILCSIVQFALLFRDYTSNVGVHLAADIVALGVMLPAATFFLTGQPSGPDFVIPVVIIWSYVSTPRSTPVFFLQISFFPIFLPFFFVSNIIIIIFSIPAKNIKIQKKLTTTIKNTMYISQQHLLLLTQNQNQTTTINAEKGCNRFTVTSSIGNIIGDVRSYINCCRPDCRILFCSHGRLHVYTTDHCMDWTRILHHQCCRIG